jgi:uncharacterized membrane protein YjjP (DUF1212 family)
MLREKCLIVQYENDSLEYHLGCVRKGELRMKNEQSLDRVLALFKKAFQVNRNPFPWLKAFNAGVASALPVLIGILFGHFEYGLLAGIGGFTYLYVFDIPYAQRAKKVFLEMLGITLSVFFGTLLAPYTVGASIMMGVIGAWRFLFFGH